MGGQVVKRRVLTKGKKRKSERWKLQERKIFYIRIGNVLGCLFGLYLEK